ncbi:MAG: hypothetical protein WC878_02885 [Candidatus Paceibacterota bacterium]|jgi:hypothetical protein
MSTGESIILIASIFAMGFGVYKIHQKKKWKLVGKIVGIIVIIILLITGAIYAYNWYQDRPHEADTLGKISLGMSPVEVTLLLGKPNNEDVDGKNRQRYFYTEYLGDVEYVVSFDETSGVQVICSEDYLNDIFGLGVYDNEQKIIDKLGNPTKISINEDGLSKFISYSQYKVAFRIQKGSVSAVCVTGTGEITFVNEYKESASDTNSF